jgi:signal transduction histidine kinase
MLSFSFVTKVYFCATMVKIQVNTARSLIILSLLLLAGFLVWFLTKTWDDELSQLKTEADLMMINAVRDIEGATFQRFLSQKNIEYRPLRSDTLHHSEIKDSSWTTVYFQSENQGSAKDYTATEIHEFIREKRPVTVSKDSATTTLIFKEAATEQLLMDTFMSSLPSKRKVDIRFNNGKKDAESALSIMLSIDNTKGTDSLVFSTDSTLVMTRLKESLDKGLVEKGLLLHYNIVKTDIKTLKPKQVFTSYTDLGSQHRYDIYVSDYYIILAQRMLAEGLFCLFLFTVIAMAFYLIDQNLKKQERLAAIKSEFIRNITHELKTPIATVSVAIEALQNFGAMDNPERTKEYLGIADTELGRLSLLVDRVLKMSLFETQNLQVNLAIIDLKAILEEVVYAMRLQFEKSKASVHLVFDGEEFSCSGDKLHLTNVIYNLLDNALKYSPQQPKISITLSKIKNTIQLKVGDNGIGIPEAYLPRIFDQFFRVPTGNIHNVKGHGLGLNYVAGVVKQHGGTIHVESKEGIGTSVLVKLFDSSFTN